MKIGKVIMLHGTAYITLPKQIREDSAYPQINIQPGDTVEYQFRGNWLMIRKVVETTEGE